MFDGRGWRLSGYRSSKLQEPRRSPAVSGSADIPEQRLHPEARTQVVGCSSPAKGQDEEGGAARKEGEREVNGERW